MTGSTPGCSKTDKSWLGQHRPTRRSARLSLEEKQPATDQNEESTERALKIARGDLGSKPGAEVATDHGRGNERQDDAPIDIAELMMFVGAHDSRGNDDYQRTSHCFMNTHAQEKHHGRDEDDSA